MIYYSKSVKKRTMRNPRKHRYIMYIYHWHCWFASFVGPSAITHSSSPYPDLPQLFFLWSLLLSPCVRRLYMPLPPFLALFPYLSPTLTPTYIPKHPTHIQQSVQIETYHKSNARHHALVFVSIHLFSSFFHQWAPSPSLIWYSISVSHAISPSPFPYT